MRQEQLDKLEEIGKKNGCELHLPPLNKSFNPFYKIGKIKNDTAKFHNFLFSIKEIGGQYRFIMDNGNMDLMEVWIDNKTTNKI